MPAAKRRKATTSTSYVTSSAEAITAFVKVSKSTVDSKSIYKKTLSTNASTDAGLGHATDSQKKRKRSASTEINIIPIANNPYSEALSATTTLSAQHIDPLPQRKVVDFRELPETPRHPLLHELSTAQTDTPVKEARSLLDKFVIKSSSTKATSPSLQFETSSIVDLNSSQSTTITEDSSTADRLPSELADLINLQSAFLTALCLHYAHNGTHSPADLRLLLPDVARAWGKRKVVLDDVRKTLGVLNSNPAVGGGHTLSSAALSLSDYGYGKICVEIRPDVGIKGRVARPLDEDRLNETFARNLRKFWQDYRDGEVVSISHFIQSLSLEPIHICSSLSKMSPLLAKGQRRLEDIKLAIVQRKQTENGKVNTGPGLTGRERPSLLERLKAKQLQQSRLPVPPSKAEVTRKAALQRLEDVASVLALLTTSTSIGQQRVSFTLPTVLGKLRDSFKTPISKEEGEACVRLLASEIAPDWLKVVKIGKLNAIVVDRENRPSELDIQERVKGATLS